MLERPFALAEPRFVVMLRPRSLFRRRRRRHDPPAQAGAVRPLAVCGPGRSGTTFLMELLASSPNIAFEQHYPYERRYLAYFARMAQLFDPPPKARKGWTNARVVAQPWEGQLGPLPFRPSLVPEAALAEQTLKALWESFSELLWAHWPEPETIGDGPVYYAEKVPLRIAQDVANVMRLKLIHLVRDPRDIMLSQISFCEQKGVSAFGYQPGMSQAEFARYFAPRQKGRLRQLADLTASDQELVLHYEGLIGAASDEVARLGQWLGVPLHLDRAQASAQRYAQHRTSSEGAAGGYRWQQELTGEAAAVFEHAIGAELRAMGYPAGDKA